MKNKRKRCALGSAVHAVLTVLCCLTLLAAGGTGCQLPAPANPGPGQATQANTDGYNYYRYQDGVTDFIYNQLWYFNFLDDRGTPDPADDIAGAAAYGLANPENRLFQQGLTCSFGMIVRDPSQGPSFAVFSPQWDAAIPGNWSASETFEPTDPIAAPNPKLPCGDPAMSPPGNQCHLQNPGGYITVISPDQYHVAGEAVEGNKKISWDLTYSRRLASRWLIWQKWPMPRTLGVIPAWIMYPMHMADAVVSGTFTVDQDTTDQVPAVVYELDRVKGYHDGFYSKFVFSIIEWDWLDYKQDNLAIQLLHPHAPLYSCKDGWETCTPGDLRVVYDNGNKVKEFYFHRGKNPEEKQIWINYDETTEDPDYPGVVYLIKETITARDKEGNKLDFHWTMLRYHNVYYDVPEPFDDNISYEMIVQATGSFYEAARGTTVPISGTGWADWSGPSFPEE